MSPRTVGQPRRAKLALRCSPEELQHLHGIADALGLTMSDLVREAVSEYVGARVGPAIKLGLLPAPEADPAPKPERPRATRAAAQAAMREEAEVQPEEAPQASEPVASQPAPDRGPEPEPAPAPAPAPAPEPAPAAFTPPWIRR